MRIGHGYDVHRLVSGRALILGGVTIPYEKGLDGHSDADVLVHAVMDALLGAAAMGDIGKLFPDNDDRYLGADSMELLREVSRRLEGAGYQPRCDHHRPAAKARAAYRADAPEYRGRTAYRSWEHQRQGNDGGAPRLHRLRRGDRRPCRLSDRIVNGAAACFISLQPRFSGRQNADRSRRVACCACRR